MYNVARFSPHLETAGIKLVTIRREIRELHTSLRVGLHRATGPHLGVEAEAAAVQVVHTVVVEVQLEALTIDLELSCLDSVRIATRQASEVRSILGNELI